MTQKIFFGDVEIKNTVTQEKTIVDRVVYNEGENLKDTYLRGRVLRRINPKNRGQFEITKLCFNTAKYLGNTNY